MDIHDLAYSLGLRNVKVDPTADTPGELADQIINAVRAVPHPTGPRLHDADLCARCGNQFKPGQVCDSCRDRDPWAGDDEVVDAHICCEHAGESPGDPEIALMAHTLAVMRQLQPDARQRYRNWVDERFARAHPF